MDSITLTTLLSLGLLGLAFVGLAAPATVREVLRNENTSRRRLGSRDRLQE